MSTKKEASKKAKSKQKSTIIVYMEVLVKKSFSETVVIIFCFRVLESFGFAFAFHPTPCPFLRFLDPMTYQLCAEAEDSACSGAESYDHAYYTLTV
jgi:hypothetical protein